MSAIQEMKDLLKETLTTVCLCSHCATQESIAVFCVQLAPLIEKAERELVDAETKLDAVVEALKRALDSGFEYHCGFPDGNTYHEGCDACQTHRELTAILDFPEPGQETKR